MITQVQSESGSVVYTPVLFRLWFDGGCEPNPGHGYGSFEIQGPGVRYKVLRQQFGIGTCNTSDPSKHTPRRGGVEGVVET